ncbi:MAG: carboxypeptidase-like regulatory domain-containing protein, partial [Holophagales bacterium]|nr:carboxypeptidase-like regulatory domain-containing protein [Holophagales bacterium]
LAAGGAARVSFAEADTGFTLELDGDGDGLFESSRMATLDTLARRPFQVIAAVQNDAASPSGHVVDVLFTEDVDLASLVPRDGARFSLPGNSSNGGLVPTEADLVTGMLAGNQTIDNPFEGLDNPRVVKVIFDNPVSPLITNLLTVSDLQNTRGELLPSQQVQIETRSSQQGIRLEGTVYGADGQPAAGATVLLYESDYAGVGRNVRCLEHVTAATTADAQGRYAFDWVRQTDCGAVFRVYAQDGSNAQHGERRAKVRQIGQIQQLDIALPGRGSVLGRITYEDGSVPDTLNVMVYNTEQEAGRLAHVGADGYYDVTDIIVGQVTLAADDGLGNFAYATFEMPQAGAVVQQNATLVRHAVAPPGSVRGVVKVVDGTPVFDAWVALYVEDQLTGVTRTGVDGRFDFGKVPAGIASIEAFTEASTYSGLMAAQVYFEVRSDRTEDVEILVRDDVGTVEGRVYRRSVLGQLTPVAGAVVWVGGTPYNATTDATGFYRIPDVFAGNWQVHAAITATGEKTRESVTVTSAGGAVARDLYFDEQLPDGGIVGTVLDFAGNPVSGATVHLAGGHLSVRWHHQATSDASGRFVIEGLEQGTYGVHAMKGADGGLGWAEIRFPGDTEHMTVRFMKGTIRGRTVAPVGPNGELEGVVSQIAYRKVEVYTQWGLVVLPPDYTYIETSPDGSFELEALAGPYELRIFNAFHGNASAHGQIDFHGQVAEHEFLFEPNGDIRGLVLDHDGETPVAGARVSLTGGNISEYEVQSDGEGSFHFPLVPPGYYQVEAFHGEGVVYRQAMVTVRVRAAGDQVDGVAVELPVQGTLSGWVEDADGYPVPGAVVTLQESRYPWRKVVQNADEEGNYAFENVFGGGPVTLYGEAPSLGGLGSRALAEISFEAEDVLTVLTLEPTGDVEGRITTPVDGSAVPRASVELVRSGIFEDATSSLDDGSFAFHRLPLGWYQAIVFDPATGRRGRSVWVELASHRQVAVADVELESRGEVQGRFMDADVASPLPGHVITLRTSRWYRVYATTDIDGYYAFGGVPEGDFALSARDQSGRRWSHGSGQIAYEDEVVTVDLTLAPFSRVTGRVHNPPGAPAGLHPNVNVWVEQQGRVIAAGFDNPFDFDGVVPGQHLRVSAAENGGLRRASLRGRIETVGQDLDVDLVLQALGQVTVEVRDSFGAPVDGASVYVANRHDFGYETFSASTGIDHTVSFADVRQGRVTALATHPSGQLDGSASGELTLDGQNLVLAVVLEETGTVRGRALRPDGVSPASHASVALQVAGRWLLAETDASGYF